MTKVCPSLKFVRCVYLVLVGVLLLSPVLRVRAQGFDDLPDKKPLIGFVDNPGAASVGTLTGVLNAASGNVNLSAPENADWTHWGLTDTASFNYKNGVSRQIGNFTILGGGAVERYSDSAVQFSWSGGTPTAGAANTATGVFMTGLNNGFQLTVQADTVPRTLKLYVGVWSAGGRLEASLSDASAPGFIDTSLVNATGSSHAVYTLNFQAGASGQTLTVRWTVGSLANGNGNVTLQAASLTAATDDTQPAVSFEGLRHYLRVSRQIPVIVRATDNVGISRVELLLDGNVLFNDQIVPHTPNALVTFNWNSAAAANGKHFLQAKAYDASGNSQTASLTIITRNNQPAPPTPPTATFSASPSAIINGQTAVLSWTTTGAETVTIDQGVGAVALNGAVNVSPTVTTTYTLTATNSAGSVLKTASVTVSPLSGNNIVLNPAVKYQTMSGWETTAEAGQLYSPAWNNYKNALFDQAVNDLGINRVRLEIKSGAENPTDWFAMWRAGQISESEFNARRYEIINDNSDPNTTNAGNFKWSQLDHTIENVVLPLRERVQARGETLWINVNYVDFGASNFEHKNNPAEYAEFVLAAYRHMQTKYGIVPNSWEIVLEPDTELAGWSETQVAQAIKAAGDRLAANGFTPNFVAPSTTSAAAAPLYIAQIGLTPGAMQYVGEFSYHRYCCATGSILQSIVSSAILYNKKAAMLEWIGADYQTLHEDLKLARNSSWQQFTLAFPNEPDNGAQYYLINDANQTNPVITIGSRTRFLRQYFKFVRAGAQRITALSGNLNFDPLAFINPNGKYAVVVKTGASGSFNLHNLPAGVYGVKYTTNTQYNIDLPDVTVNAGQTLATSIPTAGVVTVYAK